MGQGVVWPILPSGPVRDQGRSCALLGRPSRLSPPNIVRGVVEGVTGRFLAFGSLDLPTLSGAAGVRDVLADLGHVLAQVLVSGVYVLAELLIASAVGSPKSKTCPKDGNDDGDAGDSLDTRGVPVGISPSGSTALSLRQRSPGYSMLTVPQGRRMN